MLYFLGLTPNDKIVWVWGPHQLCLSPVLIKSLDFSLSSYLGCTVIQHWDINLISVQLWLQTVPSLCYMNITYRVATETTFPWVFDNLDTDVRTLSVRYGILKVNGHNLFGDNDHDSKYSEAIKFLYIKVTGVLVQRKAKKLHKGLNIILE